jgi:fructose-1,6-bisphosphatase/inositol monophosphatase family enzyme
MNRQNEFQTELTVAEQIARVAGKIILTNFELPPAVTYKADRSPVTDADTQINELVIRRLSEAFPDDGVVGEERSTTGLGTGRRWVCDPLDGTKAFIWGVPTALFSLGLVIDGAPKVGVVYDPFLDRLYRSTDTGNAYMNDRTLSVSGVSELQRAKVAVVNSPGAYREPSSYLTRLAESGAELVNTSGAIYRNCLVAQGRIDAYIGYGLKPHDMAAAHLLITQSGGQVSTLAGTPLTFDAPFEGALVSNSLLHESLLKLINR